MALVGQERATREDFLEEVPQGPKMKRNREKHLGSRELQVGSTQGDR